MTPSECIEACMPGTAVEISARSGFSLTCVKKYARFLIADGLAHKVGEVYRPGPMPPDPAPKFAEDPLLGALFGKKSE